MQRVQRPPIHLAPSQHHLQPRPATHNLHQLRAHIRLHELAASHRTARASARNADAVRARGGGGMDGGMDDEDPLEVREEGLRRRGKRAKDRDACGVATVQTQGLYGWQLDK